MKYVVCIFVELNLKKKEICKEMTRSQKIERNYWCFPHKLPLSYQTQRVMKAKVKDFKTLREADFIRAITK